MPKSRKRKIKRGGSSSRATYTSSKRSKKTRLIVFAMIGAVALAAVIFIFTSGGNKSGAPAGAQVTTASGLKYVDEKVGDGASPKTGQSVTVHYTGTLENGTKFDSSRDSGQPMTFRLGVDPMVPGFTEGISTMRVGGKRKLIIPPQLGYGPQGNPPRIPPNATLIFDIELLDAK